MDPLQTGRNVMEFGLYRAAVDKSAKADRGVVDGEEGGGELAGSARARHRGAGRHEGTQARGGGVGHTRHLKGTHCRSRAPRGYTGREGGRCRRRRGTHRRSGAPQGHAGRGGGWGPCKAPQGHYSAWRGASRALRQRGRGESSVGSSSVSHGGPRARRRKKVVGWLRAGRPARCRRGGPGL